MKTLEDVTTDLNARSKSMRRNMINMALGAGAMGAHLGPGLSIVEIMAVLYGAVMRIDPANPVWPDRDRFLLSKGHGSLGYYAGLAEGGFITHDELMSFEKPDSFLPGQPVMCPEKGIECSSGSLGLGLSIGIGIALAGRRAGRDFRTYVLMGDGECNEGTVWEAAMSAAAFKLGSLIAIIDANGMQSDGACSGILDMGQHAAKWAAFGWETIEAPGHDVGALYTAFTAPRAAPDKPLAIIANTVKGKGVSFMENNNDWHHNRLNNEQYAAAMAELAN